MTLEYQINEPYHWLTTYADPRKMLETLANREIIRYFASVDVGGALGKERGRIEHDLRDAIQQEAKRMNLGVSIVYLGLQGVHPPVEAAEAFQEVIGAEQRKAATVAGAETDSNKRLSEAAGDKDRATELNDAIREASRLGAETKASAAEVASAVRKRDVLFFGDQPQGIRPVGGEAISRIAQARAERWRLENDAHGQAVAFEQEMALKNIAPKVYTMRRYLTAVADAVKGVRKFVIATKARQNADSFLLDIRDPMQAPLGSVLEKKN
jgi:regulator of protease activity HflC (stomatin/prohibitin superfamily)